MFLLYITVLLATVLPTSSNPCTNGELLESAAIKCSASSLIKLLTSTSVTEKCGIVLDGIRPCVMEAISTDHNRTCTAREKHELVINFRDSIKQHLKFDVLQCLPVMNCTDFEATMYYLDVYCESQFQNFMDYPNCKNMCNLGTCYTDSFSAKNLTCSMVAFQNTVMANRMTWKSETGTSETDICCESSKGTEVVLSVVLSLVPFLLAWL